VLKFLSRRVGASRTARRRSVLLLALVVLICLLPLTGCRSTEQGGPDETPSPSPEPTPAGEPQQEPQQPAADQETSEKPEPSPPPEPEEQRPIGLSSIMRGIPGEIGLPLGTAPETRLPDEISPSGRYALARYSVPGEVAYDSCGFVAYELTSVEEARSRIAAQRLVELVYWRLFFARGQTYREWFTTDELGDILLLGDDKTVTLWDPAGGREILLYSAAQSEPSPEEAAQHSYDCYRGLSESIHGMVASPDGRWAVLALGGLDGRISLMRFDLRPYVAQLAVGPRMEEELLPLPLDPSRSPGWRPLEGDIPAPLTLQEPPAPTPLCFVEDRRGPGGSECFPFQSVDLWWLESGNIALHVGPGSLPELGHRYYVYHAESGKLQTVMSDECRWMSALAGESYLVLYTIEPDQPPVTEVYADPDTPLAGRHGLWDYSPSPGVLVRNGAEGMWRWDLATDQVELVRPETRYIGCFADGTWCWIGRA